VPTGEVGMLVAPRRLFAAAERCARILPSRIRLLGPLDPFRGYRCRWSQIPLFHFCAGVSLCRLLHCLTVREESSPSR
jgi:hypothetical protein